MLTKSFLVLLIVNSLVLYLANMFFPGQYALGTATVSKLQGIINSMGLLALINTLTVPVVRQVEKRMGKMFGSKEWMATYLVVNFVGIWVITRFALNLGFGVVSWIEILALAVVLDIVQGMAMMALEKASKLD